MYGVYKLMNMVASNKNCLGFIIAECDFCVVKFQKTENAKSIDQVPYSLEMEAQSPHITFIPHNLNFS